MRQLRLNLVGLVAAWGCANEVTAPLAPDFVVAPRDAAGTNHCAEPNAPLRRLSNFEYRNTLADLFPGVPLPTVALPADAAPFGFDNDHGALLANAVTLESYLAIAQQLVIAVGASAVAAVDCQGLSHADCGAAFVAQHGRRLFRRSLSADEIQTYSQLFAEPPGDTDFFVGAQLTLQTLLLAPEFLYRLETPGATRADGLTLATRLAYTLWGSAPDAELLAAAERGDLDSDVGVGSTAEAMLADPRARRGVLHFFAQWLEVERINAVTKLAQDQLTDGLRQAMAEETLRLVEHLTLDEPGTLDELLTTPRSFIDAELAVLYGVAPPTNPWDEVVLDATERPGILTRAAFLAGRAHPRHASPVLRGVFLLENIMCRPLGSPPPEAAGVVVTNPEGSNRTNRESYELTTMQGTCSSCHQYINQAGYPFENYDTMGRYISSDNGQPIDASGSLWQLSFENAADFTAGLALDPAVERCLVQKYLRYAYGGGPAGSNQCVVDDVEQVFSASGGQLRELILATVTHPEFAMVRQATEQE